ncbi:MAG: class I SAM-dependent methyltransferase [Oscillospiraceae bacterium]|nr:class I SAM-dependent methyltransferase [Oscillospiraceae bacterium]
MLKTLDEYRKAWEADSDYGSAEARIDRNSKWLQYYRYIANGYPEADDAEYNPHAENVSEYLLANGWLTSASSVLDIGSGTGTYALSFAKRCASVDALDMDSASLDILRKQAELLGLTNITRVTDMWERFKPGKKYSLTFSSMCPAICNYDELLKMETMTSDACCLLTVTRGSFDLHRKKLIELLDVKPFGMIPEALRYFEILYLMGRQPDVRNYTARYESHYSVDKAVERNCVYFEIFGLPEDRTRPVLREYFNSVAADGLVRDETQLNTALICWKPAHPGRSDAPE